MLRRDVMKVLVFRAMINAENLGIQNAAQDSTKAGRQASYVAVDNQKY